MIRVLLALFFALFSFKVHADTVTGASNAFNGPNVYSPFVMYDFEEGVCKMWYGGWQADQQFQDHIYYRTSSDCVNWSDNYTEVLTPDGISQLYQQNTQQYVSFTHVNDPSVSKHFNPVSQTYLYTMFFTACYAPCADNSDGRGVPNSIWSVVSADGVNWGYPTPLNPTLPDNVYGDATPSIIVNNSDQYNVYWSVYFSVSSSTGGNSIYLVNADGNRSATGSAFSVFNYYDPPRFGGNPSVFTLGSTWYLLFNTINDYGGFDISYATSSTNDWTQSGASPLVVSTNNPICGAVAPAALPTSSTQYYLYLSIVDETYTNSNGNVICNLAKNHTVSVYNVSQ